jgi:hypothetical protein
MMNKRNVKVDLLHACKQILKNRVEQVGDDKYLSPLKDFMELLNQAIEEALVFYERPSGKPIPDTMCKATKVTLDDEYLVLDYYITLEGLMNTFDIDVFALFVGDFNPAGFIELMNNHTEDDFVSMATVDDMTGLLNCKSIFNIDSVLNYAKRLPEPQKLF